MQKYLPRRVYFTIVRLASDKYFIIRICFILILGSIILLALNENIRANTKFMMKDGIIQVSVHSIAASTPIKYETAGWMVHSEPQHGKPRTAKFGTIPGGKQVGSNPANPKPGEWMESYFQIAEEDVRAALLQAGMDDLKHGDRFYLSAIFRIIRGGLASNEKFYSLNDIKTAEKWANPDDLDAYYDIEVQFEGPEYQNKLILQSTSGHRLESVPLESKRAGESLTFQMPKTISGQGQPLSLSSSYWYPNEHQVNRTQMNVNMNMMQIPIGGVTIVALYEPEFSPVASIDIGSNEPGKEQFEPDKAIPASEKIYIRSSVQPYVLHVYFEKFEGVQQFLVPVIGNGSTRSYTVKRPYRYWKISGFELYELNQISVHNRAIGSDPLQIKLSPSQYLPKVSTIRHQLNVRSIPSVKTIKTSANSSAQQERQLAEKSIGLLELRNDRLSVDGKIILNDVWTAGSAPIPNFALLQSLKKSTSIYMKNLTIKPIARNATYVTSAELSYRSTGLAQTKIRDHSIADTPPIVVLTPLALSISVQTNRSAVQLVKPVPSKQYAVLGNTLTVHLSSVADHSDLKGYGRRDYLKYIAKKQLKFPFDVILNGKTMAANQWLNVSPTDAQIIVRLPNYTDEGDHQIEARAISQACLSQTCFYGNSINRYHYQGNVSTDTKFEAVGKLFDLRITHIRNPDFSDVTSQQSMTLGGNGKYQIPIRPGMINSFHSGIKPGESFRFRLKTIGNYFGEDDRILIRHQFFHLDEKGRHRQQVMVVNLGKNITTSNWMNLEHNSAPFTTQEWTNTVRGLFQHGNPLKIKTEGEFTSWYKKMVKKSVLIGDLYHTSLTSAVRTFADTRSREQNWYGQFSIPNTIAVLSKEHVQKNRFRKVKGGYLILNVQIETFKSRDLTSPVLRYVKAPLGNQWRNEGYRYQFAFQNCLFDLIDGDLAVFRWDDQSGGWNQYLTN